MKVGVRYVFFEGILGFYLRSVWCLIVKLLHLELEYNCLVLFFFDELHKKIADTIVCGLLFGIVQFSDVLSPSWHSAFKTIS